MVRHLQSNVAAFAGAFTRISPVQSFIRQRISVTSAAAPVTLAALWRGNFRMVQARIFGRVN